VTAAHALRTRAHDYELAARWHSERAEVDVGHVAAADACVAIAIVLREVATVMESEDRLAA